MEAALTTLCLEARRLFLRCLLEIGQWVESNQFVATVFFATLGYALVFLYKRRLERARDWSRPREKPRSTSQLLAEILRITDGVDDGFCSDMNCIRCTKPSAVLGQALVRINAAKEQEGGESETERRRSSWQELETCVKNAQQMLDNKKSGRILEYPGTFFRGIFFFFVVNKTQHILVCI